MYQEEEVVSSTGKLTALRLGLVVFGSLFLEALAVLVLLGECGAGSGSTTTTDNAALAGLDLEVHGRGHGEAKGARNLITRTKCE